MQIDKIKKEEKRIGHRAKQDGKGTENEGKQTRDGETSFDNNLFSCLLK